MTDLAATYFQFLSKMIPFPSVFGDHLLFFPEYAVPLQYPDRDGVMHEVTMPYGTYTISRSDIFQDGLDQIRIWSRSASIGQLMRLLDYVSEAVPHGGVVLDLPNGKGAIWVRRGQPWQQRQPMDETDLQVGYCNVIVGNFVL